MQFFHKSQLKLKLWYDGKLLERSAHELDQVNDLNWGGKI